MGPGGHHGNLYCIVLHYPLQDLIRPRGLLGNLHCSCPPLPAARLMRMFRDEVKSSTSTNLSICVFYLRKTAAVVDGNGSPLRMSSVLIQIELMMGSSLFAQHQAICLRYRIIHGTCISHIRTNPKTLL